MKTIITSLKEKINKYIKNKLDISDLIKDVDIRGADLSGAIIKDFNIINGDISRCNLSNSIIGEDNKITILTGTNMSNCNFKDAVFKGEIIMKKVDAKNCNFDEAFLPFIHYEHADLRGCSFCGTVWRLGSNVGHSAKINKELLNKWGLIIE